MASNACVMLIVAMAGADPGVVQSMNLIAVDSHGEVDEFPLLAGNAETDIIRVSDDQQRALAVDSEGRFEEVPSSGDHSRDLTADPNYDIDVLIQKAKALPVQRPSDPSTDVANDASLTPTSMTAEDSNALLQSNSAGGSFQDLENAFSNSFQEPLDCAASGRTAFAGTFDVVITWYTDASQSDKNVSLLQTRIENQNEITYLLRGIDQFGMLPHVGHIFVVLDRDLVNTYGAPRNVNWTHPKLRAVFTQDLGIPGAASIYAKLASFHIIPGISEWFLYLADDIFLANPFSTDLLFDVGKPRLWMQKDLYRTPPCNCPTNGVPISEGPAHLPWLVNRCYMEAVEHNFSDYFNTVRANNDNMFSAQCTYDTWISKHGLASKAYDKNNSYGVVCHLGIKWSECPIGTDAAGARAAPALHLVLQNPPAFLNLQGSGISDDYPFDSSVKCEIDSWLHTYKPSDLTLGGR